MEKRAGTPVRGPCDFGITLYDAEISGNVVNEAGEQNDRDFAQLREQKDRDVAQL